MSNNHEAQETSHETLKTCITYQGLKISKLINKLTNSPINFQNAPLQLSRELYKSNIFLQNKANYKIARINISDCITNTYGNLIALESPTKPIQTQFWPKIGFVFPEIGFVSGGNLRICV